jgi:ankyrin repeat protein
VELLLAHGANARAREQAGTHALDWAAQNGHEAVVEMLLARDPQLLEMPGFGERTALMAAAWSGHTPLVRRLLVRGADTRRQRPSGAHVLDGAAEDGHTEVVELLLAHDPGLVDLPGYEGRTALMAAAVNDRPELVRLLLAHGADPALREPEGTRALDWACQRGHQGIAELLLAHDPTLLDLSGYAQRSSLIAAACNGHAETVAWLLARGADARLRAHEGTRALDWAAQEGHLSVVERLLAHDPGLLDLPGFRERTALAAAADNGHAQMVALLLARGSDARRRCTDGTHTLDWAAQNGHEAVVELLLAHDPDLLDLPGRAERTALIAAAGGGHESLVARLLGLGADPRRRESDGTHALDWAAQKGHLEVVRRLLAHDPGLVDLQGFGGRTALLAAAASHRPEVVSWLLAQGADVRARTADGGGALDGAAQNGDVAVLDLLLAHDPGLLQEPGYHDRPALSAAASAGQLEAVRLLLTRGADARRCEPSGTHALDWAAQEGHQQVVEMLLAHDPLLVDLPGYGGRTALIAAAANGHAPLVQLLLACGADARVRRASGSHALDGAAENGHAAVVRLLLVHEAALLELPGHGQRTPLAAAAAGGHVELVRELLTRGADPRQRRADGGNALYAPARCGHARVLELLLAHDSALLDLPVIAGSGDPAELRRALALDYAQTGSRMPDGADLIEVLILARRAAIVQEVLHRHPRLVNAPGIGGATPLMLAAATAQEGLVRALLAQGADPLARDAAGDDALRYALRLEALECAAVLTAHELRLPNLAGEQERMAEEFPPGAASGHGLSR